MVKMKRTEAGGALAPEGFEAHFVGYIAQIIVFVWDAPYEGGLERCALFDDLLDLDGREETFLAEVLQLGEHLPYEHAQVIPARRDSRRMGLTCSCSNCTLSMTDG